MALGVLNNLSAIYAESNLNNTNSSLQKVLQQLSSGSRINSGADDAAGLSLVNGLGANSAALTQSETNATEGVGLLQVADGALSQVTNLLNRAITLATEASNGTLNSTQESAANQEYQSIMSEINNIGQTTTYNQEQVFNGTEVAIYTGDSSASGSSVDDLNIRTLSESSVGDTGGKMSYSSGANSVFVNLSTSSQNAKATDTLNSNGVTTIDVNYIVKGANGAGSTASTTITVGTGTNYANTANGLISAINNAGLGITASFTSQSGAGVTGGGTQTGIQITGGMVSAGIDPNSVSTSGAIDPLGIPAGELLTQGQTVTVNVGGVLAGSVKISPTVNTLDELARAINGFAGAPVSASVVTNGDGTQSLSLAAISGQGALTVSTQSGAGALAPIFSTPSTAKDAPNLTPLAGTAFTGTATTPPTFGSTTFGVAGTGNLGTDVLSAGSSITLTANSQVMNFVVGVGVDGGGTYYTANYGDHSSTMANLAVTINSQSSALDAVATVPATGPNAGMGIVVTASHALTGENVVASNNSLSNSNSTIGLYLPTQGGAATSGSATVTSLYGGAGAQQGDIVSGAVSLTDGAGQTFTWTGNGTTTTYANLVSALNNPATGLAGVTAQWSFANNSILLTSTTNDGIAVTQTPAALNTLADVTTGIATTGLNTITAMYAGAGASENDVITGSVSLHGNGNVLNYAANAGDTYDTLANKINTANLGVIATWNQPTNSLLLTSTTPGVQNPITTTGVPSIADSTIATGTSASKASFSAGAGALSTDFVSGTETFNVGAKQFTYTGDGTSTTFADLATALQQSGLGVKADFGVTTANELTITSLSNNSTPITMTGSGLTNADVAGVAAATSPMIADAGKTSNGSAGVSPAVDVVTGGADGSQTGSNGTAVAASVPSDTTHGGAAGSVGSAGTYGTAILQLATGILTDTGPSASVLTGQIQIKNGAGTTDTFIMGANNTGLPTPPNTYYTGAYSVASLVNKINGDLALGVTANAPGGGSGGIYLQSSTVGTTITTPGTTTLANTVAFAAPTSATGVTAVAGSDSDVTVGLLGGGLNTSDILTGAISITNNGSTHSFSIGSGVASGSNTVLAAGTTMAQLATAIQGYAPLGLNAMANTTGITLSSSTPQGTAITVNSSSLADNTQGSFSSMTLGSFASESDTVTGTINYTIGTSSPAPETVTTTPGETVQQLIDKINGATASGSTYPDGVTASWVAGSNGYGSVKLVSNAEGSLGQIGTPVTSITDTTPTATLSYAVANPYNTGLSNSASTAVLYDSTTGQTQANFVANTTGTSGIATVSYSDGAGQSLSSTDLLNQADSQVALNDLNVAINEVAAMDGYIGAQINTLNSISQVMSTQQENVISAQNAIQATDYASATSNMSKYEILSQTGIAALAQANSVEQEVTKLLQ